MSKSILTEEIRFNNEEAANDFLFKHLNPLSEDLIAEARVSTVYKQTLSYLNTLPKNLDIEVYISLSGRSFNKAIKLLREEVRENVQKFFKEMTGNLTYLYEDRILANTPIFKEIQIENIKVGDVPSLQQGLSIFHKMTLILPTELPEGGYREGFKPQSIYGNLTIENAYKVLQNKIDIKKNNEDSAQEQEIAQIDKEEEIANMPFDKHMEFVELSNKPLDLTGPFLLKWA